MLREQAIRANLVDQVAVNQLADWWGDAPNVGLDEFRIPVVAFDELDFISSTDDHEIFQLSDVVQEYRLLRHMAQ